MGDQGCIEINVYVFLKYKQSMLTLNTALELTEWGNLWISIS